jgi:thiamine-phosphate pyrophosphorylase
VKEKISGLYVVTPDESDSALLADKVRLAIAGGARAVQYRNKTAGADLKRAQCHSLLVLCRRAAVPLIVNDDLALALELDADGVHLGAEDGDLAAARKRLGKGRLLGASCYDRVGLALAAGQAGADYVAFGSVFGSATKPGAVRAPLAIFSQARRQIELPLVAIGGINLQNAGDVYAAGADALAVISALFDATDIVGSAAGFSRMHQQIKQAQQ